MGKYASFEINEQGLGIKTFKTEEVCDFAYWAQNEAYKLGYATKIINRINETQILMEVAETEFIFNNLEQGKYYDEVFVLMAKKLKPILLKNPFKKKKQMKHKLDFANHNLGIYNNRIVLIDFT
jgi:hypothetical protein